MKEFLLFVALVLGGLFIWGLIQNQKRLVALINKLRSKVGMSVTKDELIAIEPIYLPREPVGFKINQN